MSYVLAILGFAALIILHEAGHFTAAKAVGMRVERFSLFFGPLLVKVRRGETEYGIGPIPLGGYVKITGMNPNEETAGGWALEQGGSKLARGPGPGWRVRDERRRRRRGRLRPGTASSARIGALAAEVARIKARSYYHPPVWKRVTVILAGPAVNLVIAFAIVAVLVRHPTGQYVAIQQRPAGGDADGRRPAGRARVLVSEGRRHDRRGRRPLEPVHRPRSRTQIASHRCAEDAEHRRMSCARTPWRSP